MAEAKPGQLLDELLLEAELTKQKHLLVEGPSDADFFRAWLRINSAASVIVTAVTEINISTGDLFSLGLNDGNRSRVIVAARAAASRRCDVRCVADRDAGHMVNEHQYVTLLWTDFPGLESYAFTRPVLHHINDVHASGKISPVDSLYTEMAHVLRELFAVRAENEHLQSPNLKAGFPSKPPRAESFDVALTVEPKLRDKVASYPRPEVADPRNYAYGHDVANVMLIFFSNEIKNVAGLSTTRALENALLTAGMVTGAYENQRLFAELSAWAT